MSIKISITELHEIMEMTPPSQNIMLVGKHGIGKSEILTEYFSQKGMKVVPLFLGQMSDPGDIIGLPTKASLPNERNSGKTDFLPPYWFPTDGKPIVLFLDELNRARPEILQTVMDLALNRKLAGKALPEGSRLISAVNEGDEYQLTDLDPALVSRFNIYEFSPSVAEWLNWAERVHVDRRVIDFIQDHPAWLDGGENISHDYSGLEKHADRRAWKKVSDILAHVGQLTDLHKRMIAGVVGVNAAAAFAQSAASNSTITGRDLLLNYDKTMKLIARYRLHEYAALNESILRFLNHQKLSVTDSKKAAQNLKQYLMYHAQHRNNEILANFTTLFSSGTYSQAIVFIVNANNGVYELLTKFIKSL